MDFKAIYMTGKKTDKIDAKKLAEVLLTLTLFRTYKTELFEIKTVKKKPVIY
jgi:hypothetical protein